MASVKQEGIKEINPEWNINSREKETILCWDLWEANNVIVTFQLRITYPSEIYSQCFNGLLNQVNLDYVDLGWWQVIKAVIILSLCMLISHSRKGNRHF